MDKRILAAGCALLCSFGAQAGRFDVVPRNMDSPLYTGLAASYGSVEVDDGESDWVAGGKMFIGYRLSEQWAVEFSARKTGDVSFDVGSASIGVDPNFGLGLSLLGFANYRNFSAFYRMGVEYADYTLVLNTNQASSICNAASGNRCEIDESEVDFLFGLGYEVMVTPQVGYRLEWESQLGGSDIIQHNIYLGVQFAF